jgi:hypothetical protein
MRDRLRMQAGIRKRPVKWGRSAGSVLRSLRKLGGGGAFALCAREGFDRFQCSLRPDPAPLGVFGWALAGNVGTGWAFALSREGDQGVDVPMLAPARSRCRLAVSMLGGGLPADDLLVSGFLDAVVGD